MDYNVYNNERNYRRKKFKNEKRKKGVNLTSHVGVKLRTHDCVGRGTNSIWDFRKYLDTFLRHKRILTTRRHLEGSNSNLFISFSFTVQNETRCSSLTRRYSASRSSCVWLLESSKEYLRRRMVRFRKKICVDIDCLKYHSTLFSFCFCFFRKLQRHSKWLPSIGLCLRLW